MIDISATGDPPRRWLITGAAGFIGSNLSRFLLARGETVVGFDNFFSGKRENIDRLEQSFERTFKFHEGDILDPKGLSAAMVGCTVVAHLAAQVSVVRSIDAPSETHDINCTGFLNTYRAANQEGVSSFVYASSCAVYGDNPALPLSEDAVPRPLSPYAATKLANEVYGAGMAVTAPDMKAVGLRFFNIFGPWQDATSGYAAVIPRWIDLLMAGEAPVIFGDGSATRDFCYVGNVCEAIWQAAGLKRQTAPAVFNVGTGVPTRLDTLYETIWSALADGGVQSVLPRPRQEPARDGEILQSFAEMSQTDAVLGVGPRIGLAEGLRRLLAEQYGFAFTETSTHSSNGGRKT